jgi:hypothetical protein
VGTGVLVRNGRGIQGPQLSHFKPYQHKMSTVDDNLLSYDFPFPDPPNKQRQKKLPLELSLNFQHMHDK